MAAWFGVELAVGEKRGEGMDRGALKGAGEANRGGLGVKLLATP
jgi:hypothetical protein